MISSTINTKITEPIKFAIYKLRSAVAANNIDDGFSIAISYDVNIDKQCYHIEKQKKTITVKAGSNSGFMYALLYLERWIVHKGSFDGITVKSACPYIKKRGIKVNAPLDARTPSYSDSSDSAQLNIVNMWDFFFWQEFIDRMAENYYNVLTLWTLSPFPSLVRIPKFPNTALEDIKRATKYFNATLEGNNMYTPDMYESLITIKKMTIDEKIEHWRKVMQYARERCVEVYLFTWNVFVYGTEDSGYEINCRQDNPATREYYYYGMKALMETYPLLAGIGVTSGENMKMDESDIDFTRETYGKAVEDYLKEHPDRDFRFIHRIQMTRYDSIMEKFSDFPYPFEISFKYSQAHMYSAVKPEFIDSFLSEKKDDVKIWLTVRNDDYYMYRWGDPDYAREYIENMPTEHMMGFYMGADGYTWGRDYMDKCDFSHPLFIDKMWYMFMIWGWVSYYKDLPDDFFVEELCQRYGEDCRLLYDTWKNASSILSLVNSVHWHDYDFQWYPEACCMYHKQPQDKIVFADIYEFMNGVSQPGSKYCSVKEYCKILSLGNNPEKKTPLQASDDILGYAQYVSNNIPELKLMAADNDEIFRTINDIEALSHLGFYYSLKIRAAVYLSLYKSGADGKGKKKAVGLLREASGWWKKYSGKSKQMYKPQVLTRLKGYVDVSRFDEFAAFDVLLAQEL